LNLTVQRPAVLVKKAAYELFGGANPVRGGKSPQIGFL